MAMSDGLLKFGGILVGVIGFSYGVGQTVGKSGEVAGVRERQAAIAATQSALATEQAQLRADVKENIAEVKTTVNKAADDAAKTRAAVERMERGGVIGARGKGQ